jgi:hypothetical protein
LAIASVPLCSSVSAGRQIWVSTMLAASTPD